eukprot:TRINITY_DN601_c0_g1_i1.p1 TRINITY_DN601_c0_g1~~TRINITY_DN601_c0_g1_i1.p1  ORF type:complete len:1076 (+),score=196.70 TRINITY_DN601_c0_g1_i1:184-3411(+)
MGGRRAEKSPRKFSTPTSGMPSERKPAMKTPQSVDAKTPLKTPKRSAKKKASAFASKKSTSRRRNSEQKRHLATNLHKNGQKHSEGDVDAMDKEESVDEILQQVKDLMRSGKMAEDKMGRDLMDALKRADETFNTSTGHDSSSADENPPAPSIMKTPVSIRKKRRRSKANTPSANIADLDPDVQDAVDSPSGEPSDTLKKLEPQDNSKSSSIAPRELQSGSILAIPMSKKKRKRSVPPMPMPRKGTPLSAKKVRTTVKIDSSDASDDEPSATRLKADIDALKKDDPDFYKFLEENDAALLDFSDSDGLESNGEEQPGNQSRDQRAFMNGAARVVSEVKKRKSSIHSKCQEELDVEEISDTEPAKATELNEIDDAESSDKSEKDASSDEAVLDTGDKTLNLTQTDEKRKEESSTPEDVSGYSENEEDEEDEEKEAATAIEARDSEKEMTAKESPEKVEDVTTGGMFVDMKYIRGLKASIGSNRSSLKVCKDLLKILRAGREVIPKAKNLPERKVTGKESRSKPKRSHSQFFSDEDDAEPDYFTDDGQFTAGKVTFASASAYQQAMSLSITSIQEIFDNVLEIPHARKGPSLEVLRKWNPTEKSRWNKVQPLFRPFVYHMILMCNSVKDPNTLRYLLKRLEKFVPYTKGVEGLARKITRVAVRVWSSGTHEVSNATRLRSYLLLNHLAHGEGNAEVVLRSCCSAYSKTIATVCNPKTYPTIHFSVMCLVELFGIDMGASYTTGFSHLREMSISLRAVLTAKEGNQEIERLHNWSYINMLRLWAKILGRYGSEDELRPLIYPYVQIALGVMRVNPSPRTHPMRLHIASFLSDLVAETGVFVPVLPHLLTVLRCSELRRMPGRGSAKKLDWRSILRVNEDVVKTKLFLTGLVDHTVLQMSKYFAIVSKHPAFPEIAHFVIVAVKKFAKEFRIAEWRVLLTSMAEKLKETSDFVARARAKADFSPHGAISAAGMLAPVPGTQADFKTPIQRFFDVENSRIEKEGMLRDEKKRAQAHRSDTDSQDDSEHEEKSEVDEDEPVRKKRRKNKPKSSTALPNPVEDPTDEDQLAELSLDSDDDDL